MLVWPCNQHCRSCIVASVVLKGVLIRCYWRETVKMKLSSAIAEAGLKCASNHVDKRRINSTQGGVASTYCLTMKEAVSRENIRGEKSAMF